MEGVVEIERLLRRCGLELAAPPRRAPSVSNRVFFAETGAGPVVVRLATRARAGVDHRAEADNARAAAALGVGPDVLWLDASTGELITALVPGVQGAAAVAGDPFPAIAAIARTLSVLHHAPPFANRFDPFAVIDELLASVARRDGAGEARTLLTGLAPVRATLVAVAPGAPCHNDPWPGNVIVSGEAATLLDWEYAGQNDPAWDFADLVLEASLPDPAERHLLEQYGESDDRAALGARVTMWKPIVDLLWSVWSLVEDAEGNEADDFARESARRLQRARSLTPAAVGAAAAYRTGDGPAPRATS